MRRLADAFVSGLSRLVLRLFFREVQVVGLERVPRGVPLLVVANHVNNLVDPMLILGFLGVRPRFLAKNTLWGHPVVAPLLLLAGALPVYRRQDAGARIGRNRETFARCRQALARGVTIALFPEGTSHNHPHPLALKSGAARILLEAEAAHGPLGVHVVPVGISYEARHRFGSRVLLQVGAPLDPAPFVARYAGEPGHAVRALTQAMADALGELTNSFTSWEEVRRVRRAVRRLLPRAAPPYEGWLMARRLLAVHRGQAVAEPAIAAALREAEAGSQGLDDRRAPRWRSPLLPVALLGALLNWLPYRLPGWISDRVTTTEDQPATYKLLAALLFFPLAWTAEVALATWLGGAAWGLAVALAAPTTGLVALRLLARREPALP